MTNGADRLTQLERRLQLVEDQLAITQLLASYGPSVDAGDPDRTAQLWTEDGEYDVKGWHMRGRDDIRAMVSSAQHQGLVSGGCLHFLGSPYVQVDGDSAVAVCESMLVLHEEGQYRVARGGANRIHLRRTNDGWRMTSRTIRGLNGTQEGRELLAVDVPSS